MIVVGMNGEVLPDKNGFPARMLVPGLFGFVSATKWLKRIEFTTYAAKSAYWTDRKWATDAPILTQSRIDVPRNRSSVPAGRVPIAGVAWAPSRGVSRVEVRVDEGEWMEADLGGVASDDTWVQWHLAWDAEPGDHEIEVRATDGDGEIQSGSYAAPIPDGAEGWHSHTVKVAET